MPKHRFCSLHVPTYGLLTYAYLRLSTLTDQPIRIRATLAPTLAIILFLETHRRPTFVLPPTGANAAKANAPRTAILLAIRRELEVIRVRISLATGSARERKEGCVPKCAPSRPEELAVR